MLLVINQKHEMEMRVDEKHQVIDYLFTLDDLSDLLLFSAADFSAFSKASIAFQFFSRNSCIQK